MRASELRRVQCFSCVRAWFPRTVEGNFEDNERTREASNNHGKAVLDFPSVSGVNNNIEALLWRTTVLGRKTHHHPKF